VWDNFVAMNFVTVSVLDLFGFACGAVGLFLLARKTRTNSVGS
jgi:hypothetical protein